MYLPETGRRERLQIKRLEELGRRWSELLA